ncbi:MAG: ribosome biogenesis GTPase Der [SAR86 cluster bacterium]|uniref:GTPase Der n=1 Tax=SAR86 cluster bacterium TaxID=2030880 RepID=A0A520N239_9GAMM|nr:MAG: ribosome biogenesis GTPase Der [SAR86 cluster bacterium]|tara:strand:- start:4031 stop:5416 length:1386 start_codon:yes stop_codon:yes gene_type:complete
MFTSIAIIGRPNVGKSTLFNKLTNSRDAIVSNLPGLTKDRNHGFINLKNKNSLLVDTGGIANEKEEIKEAISNQAWIAAMESGLILLIFDGSVELNNQDFEIISKLRKLNKEFIGVINKVDKKTNSSVKQDLQENGLQDTIEISAEHSTNINLLKSKIEEKLPEYSTPKQKGKKVAILGRPNAGKSTFINNLINEERLIVSEIAGTTIDAISVPFEFNNEKFILIDTAGIRKGYKYNENVEYFSFVRAMHAIDESDLVIFMCDLSQGIVDQDLKILNMVIENGKPLVLAFNKTDLVSKSELLNIYGSKRMQSDFIQNIEHVEISALKKRGFKKVFNLTNKIIKKSQKKFSTSMLNNLLEKFVDANSPPSISGRQLKFKYVHFGGTYPTTLIINSNQDKKIPTNYKKYLENSFRAKLDLKSVQLKIIFRKSKNPFGDKKNKLSEKQIKKRQRLVKHSKKLKK